MAFGVSIFELLSDRHLITLIPEYETVVTWNGSRMVQFWRVNEDKFLEYYASCLADMPANMEDVSAKAWRIFADFARSECELLDVDWDGLPPPSEHLKMPPIGELAHVGSLRSKNQNRR